MTQCVAIVVLGAMRVVGAWMLVWGAISDGSVEIFWEWERGVGPEGYIFEGGFVEGGRVARWREVCRRR